MEELRLSFMKSQQLGTNVKCEGGDREASVNLEVPSSGAAQRSLRAVGPRRFLLGRDAVTFSGSKIGSESLCTLSLQVSKAEFIPQSQAFTLQGPASPTPACPAPKAKQCNESSDDSSTSTYRSTYKLTKYCMRILS